MLGFLGEIQCKMDAKGRLAMPSLFLKQLPPEDRGRFIVNRGYNQCLTLYTLAEWEAVSTELSTLNLYNPQQLQFQRLFNRGAQEVTLDSNNRILLPKRLIAYSELNKDLILLGLAPRNRIEIWDMQKYDDYMNVSAADFAALAQSVMGTQNTPQPPIL